MINSNTDATHIDTGWSASGGMACRRLYGVIRRLIPAARLAVCQA